MQQRLKVPKGLRTGGERVRVLVEFVVDEVGCPRHLRVLESPSEALSESVLEAVRQSRFTPGYMEGVAVPVQMELPTWFWSDR